MPQLMIARLLIFCRLWFECVWQCAKFYEILKHMKVDKNVQKKNSQNRVCLVWKWLTDPVGVFSTLLDPPTCHIVKKSEKDS